MKAGRELDALVAEKVMGWLEGETKWVDADGDPVLLPHYSTSIADAWLVVEKLKIAVIPQSESAPDDCKYVAEYESNRPWEDEPIREFAETAPLAICLAALKAVGEEEE